jgi:hypothetical protein
MADIEPVAAQELMEQDDLFTPSNNDLPRRCINQPKSVVGTLLYSHIGRKTQ